MMPAGLDRVRSRFSVDETVAALSRAIVERGATVQAVIDHSGDAARAGLAMPATKLVIFGNARAGTPMMLAAPSAAIDLPLKLLVAEDADGAVWVSYNTPAYVGDRHALPGDRRAPLHAVEALAALVAAPASE